MYSRLNATLSEQLRREQTLASAVRTILECIGEDPDREGLRRTPERYAQAILWMTRGYEERLAGERSSDRVLIFGTEIDRCYQQCRFHGGPR